MPSKIIFSLSLCRKAGALVYGFDAVKESVNKGKAELVLCAGDVSEGTRRRVGTFCEDWVDVMDLPDTQFDLLQISKKPTGVFAVTDKQLANLCKKSVDKPAGTADALKEERPCL
ncbi:MAG: ribosomal L7Ae/L30e/S12e/Gadd45 family protein [Ruthenibacterium sp.]